MSIPEQYCMKWNNYQAHIGRFFISLFESETLVDVTLCAEGQKFQCHRVILSACSPYFQDILANAESKHPIILLPGINPEDVKLIIDFIYHGELNNINYDRFSSILKTAEMLKICGLMEIIDHIPPKNSTEQLEEELTEEFINHEVAVIEMGVGNETSETRDDIITDPNSEQTVDMDLLYTEREISMKKRKQRRESPKKYSEGSLVGALSDMKQGMPLVEAAKLHKIPRSTLYAKAKQHSGLNMVTRREHSNQDCQAAIQAVAAGMSLQRASEEYGIPKTVLWRRVQKRLDISCNMKDRRRINKCPPHVKEAAMKALVNGEKLVNVSAQYQIPVSTLFKEKARLVESGAIGSCGGSKVLKQARLSQAVAACKEGKMSQAAASTTFQVPKTTIWRRLQKVGRSSDNIRQSKTYSICNKDDDISGVCLVEENQLDLSEDSGTTKLSYIEDAEFTDAIL